MMYQHNGMTNCGMIIWQYDCLRGWKQFWCDRRLWLLLWGRDAGQTWKRGQGYVLLCGLFTYKPTHDMIKLEAGDRVLLCGLFMPRLMRMYAASVGSQPTQRNSSAEYGLELAHRSKPGTYAKDKSYYSRCGLFVPRLDFRQYDDDIWFWGAWCRKPIQSDQFHHDFYDDDDYTRCM